MNQPKRKRSKRDGFCESPLFIFVVVADPDGGMVYLQVEQEPSQLAGLFFGGVRCTGGLFLDRLPAPSALYLSAFGGGFADRGLGPSAIHRQLVQLFDRGYRHYVVDGYLW